jgi:hypothetical protein
LKLGPEQERETDLEYVQDFIYDENEPVHFRATAALWALAQPIQAMTDMNINSIAKDFREGLDIIAASPLRESNRLVGRIH